MGGSWISTGDMASVFARFHFRPHFFQHAGFRLTHTGSGALPAVRLAERKSQMSHYEHAREAYDAAPFYDATQPNQARLIQEVATSLNLRPTDSLADVGAGNGAFTNALLEHVRSEVPATVVEPCLEFMRGAEGQPHVGTTVNANLLDWAAAPPTRAGEGVYDRLLLKEVVHHLGKRTTREACFAALREHRLARDGTLLVITRAHEQPGIPLFDAARTAWAANQPAAAQLRDELRTAGFAHVSERPITLTYSMPLEQWTSLVSSRFWSTFSEFTDKELQVPSPHEPYSPARVYPLPSTSRSPVPLFDVSLSASGRRALLRFELGRPAMCFTSVISSSSSRRPATLLSEKSDVWRASTWP